MKSKIHKITLTLRFDKRVTRQKAVEMARSYLRNEFYYLSSDDWMELDSFQVISVRKFYANPRRTRNDEDAG